MFSRLIAATLLALPLLSAASPASMAKRDSCDTGGMQCCVQYEQSNTETAKTLVSALGHQHNPDSFFGFQCTPMNTGDSQNVAPICEASPVCCENDALGGLISIGCIFL
ncbi:hydrophobin family protein [Phanerochaete sordida]|uniref:Hydrophobin n=1 Tax=Phanerochaete sordida TaxID=48140 RepID=A0A9P3GCM2_9APHY|nr:hydrophobin family protein [Phanerochaete sordida]